MANNPIKNRIQRLEDASQAQRNEAGETVVDVLRDRIRARAEADAADESLTADERAAARKKLETFDKPDYERFTDDSGRPLSVVSILRGLAGYCGDGDFTAVSSAVQRTQTCPSLEGLATAPGREGTLVSNGSRTPA